MAARRSRCGRRVSQAAGASERRGAVCIGAAAAASLRRPLHRYGGCCSGAAAAARAAATYQQPLVQLIFACELQVEIGDRRPLLRLRRRETGSSGVGARAVACTWA